MNLLARWRAASVSAEDKPPAPLPRAATLRAACVVVLTGLGLLAIGQIHPEPVAQRDGIAVIHPWAKGSALKGDQLPFYVTFANRNPRADRLIKVESTAADHTILRALDTKAGMARPLELDEIAVPANGRLSLRPRTHQIALIGLVDKIEPGSSIPVTFVFERAGRLSVDIRVENLGAPEHRDHS